MVRRFFNGLGIALQIASGIAVVGLWWWGGGECHKAKERYSKASYAHRQKTKEVTNSYFQSLNRVDRLEAESIEACSEK
jgi:hypothetical protein